MPCYDGMCCSGLFVFMDGRGGRKLQRMKTTDRIKDLVRRARSIGIARWRSTAAIRAEQDLQEAMKGGDAERLEMLVRCAEGVGASRAAVAAARQEAARLRAGAALRAALAARGPAAAQAAEEACKAARTAGVGNAEIEIAKANAEREYAEQELRAAASHGGGNPGRLALATKRAAAAGVASSVVEEVLRESERVRVEGELKDAMKTGVADKIDKACDRLEHLGVECTIMKQAQVEAVRLRAEEDEKKLEQEEEGRRGGARPGCFMPRCRSTASTGKDSGTKRT